MITDDDMSLIIRDWTEQPTTLRRGGLHRALAQVEVTAQQAPPTARRFQTMFTATKFVIAGVIVALSGGAVFTGVMTKGPRDESSPAVISPAAAARPDASTTSLDPLSSAVDINVEHVTLLDDGRVLVIGRAGKGHEGITVAEVWDPETDAFRPAGSLAPDTEIRSATLLSDGRVLVIGRAGKGPEAGAVAEVWDP